MATITMFDDTSVASLPAGAAAYAGYVGGHWPTFNELKTRFPNAKLLSIAVNSGEDAECLDVETGDATIAEIYTWFKRQQARQVWKPVVYSSVSNMDHVYATMTANGFTRDAYRLWSAHYGRGEHICGPATCRLTNVACDGTQWTDAAFGRSLDQSLLNGDFFGTIVPQGPFRKVVPRGNALSFLGLAASRHMTEDNFLAMQQGFVKPSCLSPEHYQVLADFKVTGDACAAAGLVRPALVAGTVYYTESE